VPVVAPDLSPIWTISLNRIHSIDNPGDAGNKDSSPMADSFPQGNLLVYAAVARLYSILANRKSASKSRGVSLLCAITQSAGEPTPRIIFTVVARTIGHPPPAQPAEIAALAQ
jgi:hypothetical protein